MSPPWLIRRFKKKNPSIVFFPVILHSLPMDEPSENNFINSFVHPFLHSTQLPYGALSILLIPNRPLRLSICTTLILDFSFFLHAIVSLPYNRTVTNNTSRTTLKSPIPNIHPRSDINATFLLLSISLRHSGPSIPDSSRTNP